MSCDQRRDVAIDTSLNNTEARPRYIGQLDVNICTFALEEPSRRLKIVTGTADTSLLDWELS